jgi:hypothetical protein
VQNYVGKGCGYPKQIGWITGVSSDAMRDHARVLRAGSPATIHHKPCDIVTKHFRLPRSYSISFTLINHQHILCLVTFLYFKPDSSTTLTATNTKTTTPVCCLLFVQMKVICEHFTDMSAKNFHSKHNQQSILL